MIPYELQSINGLVKASDYLKVSYKMIELVVSEHGAQQNKRYCVILLPAFY